MDYMGKLAKYPALASWYMTEAGKFRDGTQSPQLFVVKICESLCLSTNSGTIAFADCLDAMMKSTNPLDEYLDAEAIFNKCEISLLDLISRFGEDAVRTGNVDRFLNAVINAADRTGIVGLRFIAAWLCLNTGDLKRCINECEKVDDPYASIYTILGQALLEQHKPEQAIEALNVAVKLSSTELLAWFQLAKAHYSLSNYRDAYKSLHECNKLAPNNIEIALFQAIVANEFHDRDIQIDAFRSLRPHLKKNSGDAEVVFNTLQLAVKAGEKTWLEGCLADIDFRQLKRDNRFPKLVSPFLRTLYDNNWMALSAKFLTDMTNCA
jgi:tetratricopeptide (TPR) repeat protein